MAGKDDSLQSIGMQLAKYDTAKEVWDHLERLYTQSNFAKQYQLEYDIRALQQNDMTIQDFYTAMSDLWDQLALTESAELKAFKPYIERREEQRLVQFLMALRSDFEGLRGTILHRSPLPTVDSVVHELIAEETRIKSQTDKGSKSSVYAVPSDPYRPPSSSLSLVPSRNKRDDDDEDYCSKRPKHDVFLSYSNEDVGNNFVSHLKGALLRNGFDISDRTRLPIGQDESFELSKAIEESWICLVVFSIEYPFSVKCLDELVLIMDSISKSNNRRRVFPIFHNVDPSHVRSQQHGPFLQAFQEHHDNHVDGEKVEKWKLALEDVGNLAGHHFQTGENEEKFVHDIVKMLGKLKLPVELFDADHPVGIERRAKDLISRLRLDDPDPSITAIRGMSGSGKTTLVKAVYDRMVPDFDASCFIENIRYYKDRGPNWKVDLQKDVISQLTGDDYQNHNVSATSNIRKFVSNRKVLIVLDDVDKVEQLQALGIRDPAASFALGSRIVMTTTNKESLSGLHKCTSYDIELLNEWESSELFTGFAYEKGQFADEKFVDEIVDRAGGVPLVLELWGRYFKNHERKHWPRLLEKLRRIPHKDVQGKLKVSYDSLSPRAKNLFLDIACFFDGWEKDLVIKVLEDKDNAFFPDIEIQDLIDKGLVKDDGDRLTMHAVIRDMGREVVRQENEDDPGQRSRLVGKDVVRVLRDCSGIDSIRSIYMNWYVLDEDVTVQVEALRKMSNLWFIKLPNPYLQWSSSNDEVMSPLCFKYLKYLEWERFPYKSLDMFDMENVVVIQLFKSKMEILWERESKSLKKLEILKVRFNGLTRTGSFIGLENLKELVLTDCHNLKEVDGSIGCLQKLVTLRLTGCNKLKRIPWEMIGKLTSLEKLYLDDRPDISNIAHELQNLSNILHKSYDVKSMGGIIYVCFKSYDSPGPNRKRFFSKM